MINLAIGLFIVAASFRMYFDYVSINTDDVVKIAGYFFGTVCIPTVAISCCFANYDPKIMPPSLFAVAGLGCALIFVTRVFGIALDADVSERTGRLFFESLNPTQIAYAGFAVIVSALALWRGASGWFRGVMVATVGVSGYLIVEAASRGPLIALALGLAFVAWVQKRYLLLVSMLTIVVVIGLFISDSSLVIVDRLTASGIDTSSIERLDFIVSNFQTAVENPLFGAAYVDPVSQSYPHLTLLESAVALGVGGAALMLYIQIRLLLDGVWLGRHGDMVMTMLIISVLIQAYLSGSIWQSSEFWVIAGFSASWVAAARRVQARAPQGSSGMHQTFPPRSVSAESKLFQPE